MGADLDADIPFALAWPKGVDEEYFLDHYWQRKPLLIRQAWPDFDTPLPADELAGLSLEAETTPRLIRRDDEGGYRLTHGPFNSELFATLGAEDWSLLVTDVEKHIPELQAWLHPFRFVPDWRFDDLMISFAPDGASVGAHVDQYDVFLLQASGTRRWSIDTRQGIEFGEEAVGDLRLVKNFKATETWVLEPGDILYLPPGIPHHGVAVGNDCTTWSIGFRAPSVADIVSHAGDWIAERLPPERLKVDNERRQAPGEISAATLAKIHALWVAAVRLDPDELLDMTGTLLTRTGTAGDSGGTSQLLDPRGHHLPYGKVFRTAAFARIAWAPTANTAAAAADGGGGGGGENSRAPVRLFINGEVRSCARHLAIRLCDGYISARDSDSPDDLDILAALATEGILLPLEYGEQP